MPANLTTLDLFEDLAVKVPELFSVAAKAKAKLRESKQGFLECGRPISSDLNRLHYQFEDFNENMPEPFTITSHGNAII